uniref:Uncharacterized protein n=1 Tax=Meloidogyne floridensis TaxID=298350 RepID=A0A915NDW7_9BILA
LQGSDDIKEKSKELEKVINVYEASLCPMINKLSPPSKKEYALSEDCLKATLKSEFLSLITQTFLFLALDPKPTNIQAVNPLNAEHDYFEVVFSRVTYASVGLAKINFPKQEQFGHLKNSIRITSNASSLDYENENALIPSISLADPQATFEVNFGEKPLMFKK